MKFPVAIDINETSMPIKEKTIANTFAQFFPFHNPLPTKIPRTPNAITIIARSIALYAANCERLGIIKEIIVVTRKPPKISAKPEKIVNPEPIYSKIARILINVGTSVMHKLISEDI